MAVPDVARAVENIKKVSEASKQAAAEVARERELNAPQLPAPVEDERR